MRTDPADDPHFMGVAAVLLGIGALGVVATSVCYALAGPEAALSGGASSVAAARAATATAAAWMRAAGLIGMPSDVLLTVGGVMMALSKNGKGAGRAIAGWLAMAVGGVLFIVVDAMVALVLPPAALGVGASDAGYPGLRALFDALFTIGAWATGAGALAAVWSAHWPELRWPAVRWSMRAAGALGVLATTAHLLGLPGAPLIGPGIALIALALLGVALAVYSGSAGNIENVAALGLR